LLDAPEGGERNHLVTRRPRLKVQAALRRGLRRVAVAARAGCRGGGCQRPTGNTARGAGAWGAGARGAHETRASVSGWWICTMSPPLTTEGGSARHRAYGRSFHAARCFDALTCRLARRQRRRGGARGARRHAARGAGRAGGARAARGRRHGASWRKTPAGSSAASRRAEAEQCSMWLCTLPDSRPTCDPAPPMNHPPRGERRVAPGAAQLALAAHQRCLPARGMGRTGRVWHRLNVADGDLRGAELVPWAEDPPGLLAAKRAEHHLLAAALEVRHLLGAHCQEPSALNVLQLYRLSEAHGAPEQARRREVVV
jgi:hypothetical protein